jgi:hypothetical protein
MSEENVEIVSSMYEAFNDTCLRRPRIQSRPFAFDRRISSSGASGSPETASPTRSRLRSALFEIGRRRDLAVPRHRGEDREGLVIAGDVLDLGRLVDRLSEPSGTGYSSA